MNPAHLMIAKLESEKQRIERVLSDLRHLFGPTTEPTTRRGRNVVRTMQGWEPWARRLLADVLAKTVESETAEFARLAAERLTLPDGSRGRVAASTLRSWRDILASKEAPSTERSSRRRRAAAREEEKIADVNAERARLMREGKIGNPVELREELSDPDRRRPLCPAYSACLAFADRAGWESFACDSCRGPGPKPKWTRDCRVVSGKAR